MKCEQSSEITAYLQGEGSEEERVMLRRHFEQCESCARELGQFERAFGALGRIQTVEPSRGFKGRVEAAFVRAHPELQRSRPRLRLIAAASIAAALVLAAVFYFNPRTEPDGRMGHIAPEGVRETDPEVVLPRMEHPKSIDAGAWAGSAAYDRRLIAAVGEAPEGDKEIVNALQWLAARQEADGSWKGSDAGETLELTALSVLVLGPGGGSTARNGMKFLISRQRDSGVVGGGSPESHAIATLALLEGSIRTKDAAWTRAAAKAVAVIAQQNQDGPWGRGAVAGWQYHVLRLAAAAGDRSLIPALVHGYAEPSAGLWTDPSPDRDRWSRSVAPILDRSPLPGTEPANFGKNDLRLAYFGTTLLRPLEGDAWTKWWSPLKAKLLKTQAADGSWPAGFMPGKGQIYVTALSTLILQTPRRVPPLAE